MWVTTDQFGGDGGESNSSQFVQFCMPPFVMMLQCWKRQPYSPVQSAVIRPGWHQRWHQAGRVCRTSEARGGRQSSTSSSPMIVRLPICLWRTHPAQLPLAFAAFQGNWLVLGSRVYRSDVECNMTAWGCKLKDSNPDAAMWRWRRRPARKFKRHQSDDLMSRHLRD